MPKISSLTPPEQALLAQFLNHVAEYDQGFLPDDAYSAIHRLVPWPATEVCVANKRGELLLQYREFTEWPGEFGKIKSWYIPGGYMLPGLTLAQQCYEHLKKDGFLSEVRFINTAGVIKWEPGEHPFAVPVSIACVCQMASDTIPQVRPGMEDKFKFVSHAVGSDVPHHTELQQLFFKWRDEHPQYFEFDLVLE